MGFFQLHPNIRIRIVTSFLTRVVGTMIFPFMAIYFSDKLGQALAGFLLFMSIIAQILTSFYGGYIADRWGRKKVLVYGQLIQCGAFSIMALANSPLLDSAWLTFAMMLVQSASNGLINPAADAMLIDVSTKENRTFMYSISYWASNLSIAMYLGALLYIGGYAITTYSNALWVIILTMFLATVGELMHIPTRQTYLAEIVRDDARSSYMAVNGLVLQGAKLSGAIGISLGAILPSYAMALLFAGLGVCGLLLIRIVVRELEQSGHTTSAPALHG
ncbi:MFS transporter [Brevibacillus invocatus]|uniref:MFS transporter n=1 Tax=Brevibacillus invocatus TaxID=173959 RepID=UPI00203A640B|nr:MFS transporter [Brevibacillus invocatus]MCM3081484.1 MFS transporter [Brevibacillus invocatus]MCM3431859.1 MFS transporter [Brevibacillus invocatus]